MWASSARVGKKEEKINVTFQIYGDCAGVEIPTIIKYNRGAILMPQDEWPQSEKKEKT